jgi:hypothetical protein
VSEFFEGRKIVKAEELRGPRVYSTDLVTSLYDLGNPADSVEVTERALKIKIITKGLVTLNCAYLVSPLAVRLLERNPDFFAGDAILPVFRSDKSSLADFVSSIGDPKRFGITEAHLSDHIANVQRQIRTVMPWELEGVADTFRTSLVQGLRDPNSVIAEQLTTRHGLNASQLERIARDIDTLDLRSSSNLWDYTATLDQAFQKQLNTFAKASYHLVGSAVVRCETGLDLSPLSEVKAADFILAQNARLSDEVLFIERFMDYALEAISPALVPTRIIDSLTFEIRVPVTISFRNRTPAVRNRATCVGRSSTMRSARSWPIAVRHRSPRRACRPAQQEPQRPKRDVRECRSSIGEECEAEMFRVPRDGAINVIDHIADIHRRHLCLTTISSSRVSEDLRSQVRHHRSHSLQRPPAAALPTRSGARIRRARFQNLRGRSPKSSKPGYRARRQATRPPRRSRRA